MAAAVTTMTRASAGVDRRTDRATRRSIIRTAVTMSTPASAASGMTATSPPPATTTTMRTSEWTMAETRVRAPARTLTAVRAMAPVAGIPPNAPDAMFARPCPTSSRSGSYRPGDFMPSATDVMPSATRAESRLSMAANAATAIAAENRAPVDDASRTGILGAGRPSGRLPMRLICQPTKPTATVARTIAMIDQGTALLSRGITTRTTTTSATTAMD